MFVFSIYVWQMLFFYLWLMKKKYQRRVHLSPATIEVLLQTGLASENNTATYRELHYSHRKSMLLPGLQCVRPKGGAFKQKILNSIVSLRLLWRGAIENSMQKKEAICFPAHIVLSRLLDLTRNKNVMLTWHNAVPLMFFTQDVNKCPVSKCTEGRPLV